VDVDVHIPLIQDAKAAPDAEHVTADALVLQALAAISKHCSLHAIAKLCLPHWRNRPVCTRPRDLRAVAPRTLRKLTSGGGYGNLSPPGSLMMQRVDCARCANISHLGVLLIA